MWATEPPPAPTVWMSIDGRRTGKPATLRPKAISALPSRTRQTSVEVPPMSNVMRSLRPARAPAATAPTTPAAGPDRAVRIGISPARPTDMSPPEDWQMPMLRTGRVPFDRGLEPAHVAAGDRLQEGVEHGGGEPLVLAELGLDLAGERDVDAGQRRPQRLAHAPLVRRD